MQAARLPMHTLSSASMTMLLMPWRARPSAVARPTGPPPTMATRVCCCCGNFGGSKWR